MLALKLGLTIYLVVGLILALTIGRFVARYASWSIALGWYSGTVLLGPALTIAIVGVFILVCLVFYPACWAEAGWQRFELWLAKMEWPAIVFRGLKLTKCPSCGGLTDGSGWCPTCVRQASDTEIG